MSQALQLPFVKMQAQGNDFVIFDAMHDEIVARELDLSQENIQTLCNQHVGIGCDQLLLLQAAEHADALLLIYNADGSPAANCGNGLRCVGDLLMCKLGQKEVSIALADRVVIAYQTDLGVAVNMGKAKIEHVGDDYTDVNMGNPHRVYFANVQPFPERNVEIIADYAEQYANIRIIERGTGETLACGSGACATAAAIWHKLGNTTPLHITMPGGDVVVSEQQGDIHLAGQVQFVFSGSYVCH